jgi:hypothetical protein
VAIGATLVLGALSLLPAGLGLVSPRPRHAVLPPAEIVTPEREPPPSRLAAPGPQRAEERSLRALPTRGTAHRAEDAAGALAAPSAASTEHASELARLALSARGSARPGATFEIVHEPLGLPARRLTRAGDDDGRCRLELAPGRVRVVAWADAATALPVEAELAPGVVTALELDLEPSLPVLGRVIDARTGAPIAGAEVSLWTFAELDRVVSGPDGTFHHARFPAHAPAQQLAACAPGYGRSVRYLRIAADGAWKLAARHAGEESLRGSGTPWIELELVPELVLHGHVVDEHGAPLVGVHITAEGFQRVMTTVASRDAAETRSASDGSFELRGLRSDIGHALTLLAPGLAAAPLELAPTGGVLDLGALVLEPAGSLTGIVLDSAGLPVAAAEVVLRLEGPEPLRTGPLDAGARLAARERRLRAGEDGRFLFEGLWPVPAWLRVEHAGAEAEALLVPAPAGGFAEAILTLVEPATLAQRGD